MRRKILGVLAAFVVCTTAHPLFAAEPNAADKETARRLMAEGRAQRASGDLRSALVSFASADAIMHVPTTGFEVAATQLALGQLVEARDELLAVARIPAKTREPAVFAEARKKAAALQAEIEPRIPSITLKLEGAPADVTTTVTVDGVEVPEVALSAPRAVNPGHHVVKAVASGAESKEVGVDVTEGQTQEVVLELVKTDAAPPPADTKASDSRETWRDVGYVGVGVGAVAIVIGAVTGAVALSDFSTAKGQGCVQNMCPPSTYPELNKASTMATVSTVGFVVGGAAVAGGVLLLVLGRSTPPNAPPASTSLGVTLGPLHAGIVGTF
jgi:hypothetical protein